MKSHPQKNSRATGSRIEYDRSLHPTQNEAEWLNSMAKVQNFRAPWAPLRGSDAPGCARDIPTSAAARESKDPRTESRSALVVPEIVPFEAVCEEIRRRNETKTAILEEALQRSQTFQQRFWGINE